MPEQERRIAYIDGANLHKGVTSLGWKLDHVRFRSWLRQKYAVDIAYLFIGLIPAHADMYSALQRAGYQLIFKEVIYDGNGKAKGNCDADLVLQATRDCFEQHLEKAVLVSSDGDYAPLIRLWQEKGIPCFILSPAPLKNVLGFYEKRMLRSSASMTSKQKLLVHKRKSPRCGRIRTRAFFIVINKVFHASRILSSGLLAHHCGKAADPSSG